MKGEGQRRSEGRKGFKVHEGQRKGNGHDNTVLKRLSGGGGGGGGGVWGGVGGGGHGEDWPLQNQLPSTVHFPGGSFDERGREMEEGSRIGELRQTVFMEKAKRTRF